MNSSLTRMFECLGGTGWWIIVLFFLFLAFQECWTEICLTDWIPFLILLLIVCSCVGEKDSGTYYSKNYSSDDDDNKYSCECNC